MPRRASKGTETDPAAITITVDCTICYDKHVIHFTDLPPSNQHQPTPGQRPNPPRWRTT